ncbi:MAG: DUF5134 domain-containing protein [Catenulispora sp.]|nr:DUF5134 domain-containing protein [Catenulispora sp.]
MPGMDMGTGGRSAALVLAELTLFWGVTLLHLIRLLFITQLTRADRAEDTAHLAMGTGMTLMVFPGVPVGVLHLSAVVFTLLALVFFTLAGLGRAGRRCQNTAIGAGQAAMAYMFAAPAHPPTWLPPALAGVLAVCALIHARRLIRTRHRRTAPDSSRIPPAVTHAGTLLATATMAWMVVAA